MSERLLAFEFNENIAQRLDHFLVEQLPEHSRSFLQHLIKEEVVKVNGEIAKKSGLKLESGQVVEVRIPPPKPSHLVPEHIPLTVVFENEDLIVIDKPAGMVAHPSVGHSQGTLVHAVLAHAPDIGGVGGVLRPGLVHRLDKDTSGLIVLAKNDLTHRYLQAEFKERRVEKVYLALVEGQPPTPEGRVEAAIGRDPRNRKRMAVVPEAKGRMAVSEYITLERFENHSLLEVRILTGRTHQIRVHLAFVNCPVVGDRVYGRKQPTVSVGRQFLHASRLAFAMPGDSEPTKFEAPLPSELSNLIETLRG